MFALVNLAYKPTHMLRLAYVVMTRLSADLWVTQNPRRAAVRPTTLTRRSILYTWRRYKRKDQQF